MTLLGPAPQKSFGNTVKGLVVSSGAVRLDIQPLVDWVKDI